MNEARIAKRVAAFFHRDDDLLRGITFGELIDTVYSNERVIDERTVTKTFNELLKANVRDAKSELKGSMKKIIEEASHE